MPRTTFSAAVQAKLYYPRYYRLEISAGNWCDDRMPAVPVGRYRPFPVRDTIADAGPGSLLAVKIIDSKRPTRPFHGILRRPGLRGLAAEAERRPAPMDGLTNRFAGMTKVPDPSSTAQNRTAPEQSTLAPYYYSRFAILIRPRPGYSCPCNPALVADRRTAMNY